MSKRGNGYGLLPSVRRKVDMISRK